VNQLDAIRKSSERTAKKLKLEVNQIVANKDGTYNVEYIRPTKEVVVKGFSHGN